MASTRSPSTFRRSGLPLTVALAALSMLVVGCSADQSTGGRIAGQFATVFSSLPLQGPHAGEARDVLNAEKLALRDAGGRAGRFKINFALADDATAQSLNGTAGWNANRTADNARTAVQNPRTIFYIGDLDSNATAISLPITNGAGIPQVSPASTAVGLTRPATGADKGEPDKYYPSGDQTFARVVPAADVQASAAARWAKQLGARRVYLLGDKSIEGDGLTDQFGVEAGKVGLTIADENTMDPRAKDYVDLAKKIASANPDTVFFGGGASSNALTLWRDLHAAMPGARLMGSDGLLVPSFYAKLGAAGQNTYLTSSVQDPRQLPPTGQHFLRRYRRVFRSTPGPYAAYGYTAMSMVLDAIARAGSKADQRKKVVEALIATHDFDSSIGTFSIDSNGDTSLDRIAGYKIRAGAPVFSAALRGERAPNQK